MGFDAKIFAKSLCFVLLVGALACLGQTVDAIQVTVLLQNHAHLPNGVIQRAESEAGRIFRASGIELRWVDCTATHQCHRPPGPNEFVLSLVEDGNTSSDLAFGVAFMGPDGVGKYSDLFVARIERECAVSGQDIARLMGAVAAHELGHLVLGSHAHSEAGVMTPIWNYNAMHRVGLGSLLFTREQSALMRQRVRSDGDLHPWATASVKVRWEPPNLDQQ